ncbi:Malonyl-CoA:anthocyanidin 5-O-glucoside-6''-O-malonyltransferase [Linum grandiflorum]
MIKPSFLTSFKNHFYLQYLFTNFSHARRISTIRVIEICRVAPSLSPLSASDFSLPLTFFDTFWLKFSPVERIFFYRLPSSSDANVIIPRLKRSLSIALRHFLPLAGKLTWPEHANIPFVLYTPQSDGVSLTIAESTEEHIFDLLSGDGPREASLSSSFVPKLDVTGPNAAVLALQVTVFPRRGFSVGITSHHAVLDGKSSAMFMKAWAHVSKELGDGNGNGGELITEKLTPFLDRTAVKDPDGIALEDMKTWTAVNNASNSPRSLEYLWDNVPPATRSNRVRGTFKLSREDISKLKKITQDQLETVDNHNHTQATESRNLSTFVITLAHTLVCMAKAKDLDDDKPVMFGFVADCRSRMEPPLPANYFGNCVLSYPTPAMKIGDLVHDGGTARVARTIIEMIKKLDDNALEGAKGKLGRIIQVVSTIKEGLVGVGVAGSPRLGVYDVDFGFGRPVKVEVTSIDRTSAISMAESGDGSGGVEIGVVLLRHEMDKFASSFFDGLINNL